MQLRVPVRPAHGTVYAEATGVCFGYGGEPVLRGADLAVFAGEVLALVDPNGSGKSTLLSVLAGDMRPRAGAVHLDGRPVAAWTARELALRRECGTPARVLGEELLSHVYGHAVELLPHPRTGVPLVVARR